MARLHSWVCPFVINEPGFSGKMPTKIIKSRAIKRKGKSPWRVPSSSPVIQKKKLKAKHRKNNLKKMVHNPKPSNSDKNDDTNCCK
jgi:hypothetical protein